MIKNAQHFEPVGSVDCSHLKTMTKGQLCALTAYDASKHIATMCFALFRTETSANWEMFMERVFKYFPRFKTIISDGAKGLESLARLFVAHGVFHARCFWHVIEKNARQSGIAMTDADKARAWTIVMSRTREFALFHSERLMGDNRKLFDFISPNLPVCASYELLEQGKPRRGLKTSNPSEQFNGAVGVDREGAVVDLLTGVLQKMANNTFLRRTDAQDRLDQSKYLAPRAEKDHALTLAKAQRCVVYKDEVTETHMKVNMYVCFT